MEQPSTPVEVEAPSRSTRLNLERARAMLAAWRESGLSRVDFAEKQGICLKTFDRWRGKVEGTAQKSGGLARVEAAGNALGPTEAVRVIPGMPPQVVLPNNWDAVLLHRVLEACRC